MQKNYEINFCNIVEYIMKISFGGSYRKKIRDAEMKGNKLS